MTSTTLPDGTIKHTIEGWTGFQLPGDPMTATKWLRDDMEYWEIKGSTSTYIVTKNLTGQFNCDCTGFRFRKYCKHVNEAKRSNK